ncbi:uncharacterized protein [Montipora capricornis]|uniref:uncharacterized protein isoform X2 n=1 Tax=Montipora foliosa TaxID=591990 RepID=UPI0035F18EA9
MKNSNRIKRRMLRESHCTDVNGKQVKHEDPFVPKGKVCQHCTCLNGYARECVPAKCAVPTCKDYKAVPGECCAYTCPSGNNSAAAELAIIISLSVGLLLLLVLLIFMLNRNRKKSQRDRIRNEVIEQSQRPLNNRLAVITEENNDNIEPPPPYTPGRGRYSLRKAHYTSPPFTPNEPPPPYEIDSREATDV